MAYVGHGLVGDQTYGGRRKVAEKAVGDRAELANGFPRQALHAATLGFDHPVTGERLEFAVALPADMAGLIGMLRVVDSCVTAVAVPLPSRRTNRSSFVKPFGSERPCFHLTAPLN